MIDKIGIPRVTPVAPVGDRQARPHQPRAAVALREAVKPKTPRDEFLATGEKSAPKKPLVYDRSVQWQQQIFTDDAEDKGQGR